MLYALLAGVAIGMLIAPDKGSETRKRLFCKLDDLSDDFSDAANNFYEKSKTKMNEGLNKAKDMAS